MLDYRVPLDAFEVHEPIARGAGGEVWRGVHIAQQTPVAVKVLTAEHARNPRVCEAFHNEARAMARLHHPGIVHILDYGFVDRAADVASDGRLVDGSPFLVMEYASGGTLPKARSPMPWGRLRSLLLELLDSLAHAHARGVVHRDIKPGNILIATPSDGRPGLKLTDFGIARAVDAVDQQTGVISGTPRYMAPEQVLDHARDQGPWTDLYALGCLAYQLATGRRMYPGKRGAALLRCQVHVPPPPLDVPQLPEGFGEWLNRMLAKRPEERFQMAADAAWGLVQLGRVHDTHPMRTVGPGAGSPVADDIPVPGRIVATLQEIDIADALLEGGADTMQMDISSTSSAAVVMEAVQGEMATLAEVFVSEWERAVPPATENLSEYVTPPLSETWRRLEPPRPPQRLVGAGLGLWGLRTIPMVDRNDERDEIWQALREVGSTGRARCVVVRGGPGYGKSRLVEWICERAHELGVGNILKATHGTIAGRLDGLGPMVAQALGCLDLDRDEAFERALSFVETHPLPLRNEEDALAFVELMRPAGSDEEDGDSPRVRFSTPGERYGLIQRFLARVATRRPVIIWLDDAHWGADSLAFVEFLMELQYVAPTPILVLATVRDDALSSRPVERPQLGELLKADGVVTMDISPLPSADHQQLVGELLGLEGRLAQDVAARTDGNPLFAIQLVGDWVSRGVLEVGDRGLRLRAGETSRLPDDIHQLWWARVSQLFPTRARAEEAWESLEVAAALGKDLYPREWQLACAQAGVRIPDELLETMLGHRLLVSTPMGVSFAHGMLRESLQRSADETQRSARHHAACAAMLAQAYTQDSALVEERRAAHLLLAEQRLEALEPLLRAARGRTKTADYRQAHELLRQRKENMLFMKVRVEDRRWVTGWLVEIRALLAQGNLEAAAPLVARVKRITGEQGFYRLAVLAARDDGYFKFNQGDTSAALDAFRLALKASEPFDMPVDRMDILVGMGGVLYFRHELDAAERVLLEAIALHGRARDPQLLGKAFRSLGNVYQTRGDFDAADRHLRKALATFEDHGYQQDKASCLNDLGETARICERLEDAERYYRSSGELYESLGSTDATTPWFNLGLVLLARESFAAAGEVFRAQRERLERSGAALDLVWIYAGLVPCAAARGDWGQVDWLLTKVEKQLAKTGVVDGDIPWLTELAARLAVAGGQRVVARRALEVAERQRLSMDDAEALARVRRALSQL